jgi:hypothetical protein
MPVVGYLGSSSLAARTIEDFAHLSARIRAAMDPHVVDILRHDLSVILNFPANTPELA